jgi:hypothetical protein
MALVGSSSAPSRRGPTRAVLETLVNLRRVPHLVWAVIAAYAIGNVVLAIVSPEMLR